MIIVGDVNTLYPAMDRSSRHIISKDRVKCTKN